MDITNVSAIQSLSDVSRYTDSVSKVTGKGEEDRYSTGESDNWHDLMVAQQKANISLQYTVAVKNTALEAYRTLMNMQM